MLTFQLGPKGQQLQHCCGQCQTSTSNLLKCSGCNAVRYCSREHQQTHWHEHKSVCSTIKKHRKKVAKEDTLVRNATPDFMTPANAFETHVGDFWGLLNTRDYMRARYGLAEDLRRINTLDSVQESCENFQDMLRLCRGDNMGVRHVVPSLMLQLGRDQECYDFAKSWIIESVRGDPTEIKNADVCEGIDGLDKRYPDVNMVLAVILIKMKLLVDIRNLKVARKERPEKVPNEIQINIEHELLRPISMRFQKMTTDGLERLEKELHMHAGILAETLEKSVHYLWYNMLNPVEALIAQPMGYSHGSVEETQLAVQNCYAAWWQTPAVLEILEQAAEKTIPTKADYEQYLRGQARLRTDEKEEPMTYEDFKDAQMDRCMWGHVDLVMGVNEEDW